MKLDFFKIVAILFLLSFFTLLIYYGFKEPPQEVIKEVEKSNAAVSKEIDKLLNKGKQPVKNTQITTAVSEPDVPTMVIPAVTVSTQGVSIVSEIAEKNKRILELSYVYKDFRMNYLRYQQATSGEKFPEKGKLFKEEYEKLLQKLLTYNTQEDYITLIDLALLKEWGKNVKDFFFKKLGELESDLKDKIILDKLLKINQEENMMILAKGLSSKLSSENKERLLNIFSKIPSEYEKLKKQIQEIINKQ